jgi:hypothetical protein
MLIRSRSNVIDGSITTAVYAVLRCLESTAMYSLKSMYIVLTFIFGTIGKL